MRRRSSACAGDAAALGGAAARAASFGVVDFLPFLGASTSKPLNGYLGAFFSVRPRGVLQVSVPIVDAAGGRSVLRVCTTHLPHASENKDLLADLAKRMQALARAEGGGGAVLFGGDFNPLPGPSLAAQFAPLLATGSQPTNPLATRGGDHGAEGGDGGAACAKGAVVTDEGHAKTAKAAAAVTTPTTIKRRHAPWFSPTVRAVNWWWRARIAQPLMVSVRRLRQPSLRSVPTRPGCPVHDAHMRSWRSCRQRSTRRSNPRRCPSDADHAFL